MARCPKFTGKCTVLYTAQLNLELIPDMLIPCRKHTSCYCPPTRKDIPGSRAFTNSWNPLSSTTDIGWMSVAIMSTKEVSSFLHLGESLAYGWNRSTDWWSVGCLLGSLDFFSTFLFFSSRCSSTSCSHWHALIWDATKVEIRHPIEIHPCNFILTKNYLEKVRCVPWGGDGFSTNITHCLLFACFGEVSPDSAPSPRGHVSHVTHAHVATSCSRAIKITSLELSIVSELQETKYRYCKYRYRYRWYR